MPDTSPLPDRPIGLQWATGLAPLWSGLGFFLLGTQDLLKRFLPPTSSVREGMGWAALCLVAIVFVAVPIWGTRAIRARAFSLRSGYAQPKSRNWLLLPVLVVPMVLVTVVIAYAFTSHGRPPTPYALYNDRLVTPGFAVTFAVSSLYYGWKRRVPLLLAYAIYLTCLALLIWWLPLSPVERGGLLLSGAGGPLAVFGAIRLRAFLSADSKPPEGLSR
ncbi:MAG TPA: hypothetical protein VHN11_19435 [Xanthobacteraceae bacterium]|nr:hypothetical protein [Xanthobacteraceae bacterium]